MTLTLFQQKILQFYKENKRDLPWRRTTDRYAILVSEIMLQQTQVDRVIPKYLKWLEAFPTPNALALAPLSKVLELWQGLGYNNRAKRLHDACKIIVEQHNGLVPDTVEELIKLPGIGPYTARSVLIFADNQDLATVDTNIRRILIKELNLPEDTCEKELFLNADRCVPTGRSRDWHNALMDYGSQVFTAKTSGIKPTSTQGKFEGSTRQVRSHILRLLLKEKSVSAVVIKNNFAQSEHDIDAILRTLERDGLIEFRKHVVHIKQ